MSARFGRARIMKTVFVLVADGCASAELIDHRQQRRRTDKKTQGPVRRSAERAEDNGAGAAEQENFFHDVFVIVRWE